jgi:hypothetical protein
LPPLANGLTLSFLDPLRVPSLAKELILSSLEGLLPPLEGLPLAERLPLERLLSPLAKEPLSSLERLSPPLKGLPLIERLLSLIKELLPPSLEGLLPPLGSLPLIKESPLKGLPPLAKELPLPLIYLKLLGGVIAALRS